MAALRRRCWQSARGRIKWRAGPANETNENNVHAKPTRIAEAAVLPTIGRSVSRRALLAGAMATSVAGAARAAAIPKIGYVHPRTVARNQSTLSILRPVWRQLGYVEGETFLVRSADGDSTRIPGLVADLKEHGVNALILVGPEAVNAARSTQLPIVAIDLETDPVRAGLAQSFNRPGGNLTGLYLDQPSIAAKWIELLQQAVPGLTRVALVWDPITARHQLEAARAAAAAERLEAPVLELPPTTGDYDAAFARLADSAPTGVVQLGSPGFGVGAARFASAAAKYRLASIALLKTYARAGLLMSYGPNQEIYFQRAVILADKIVRGERAGEIPIERPATFELALNLGTAKAIGLSLPAAMLARAEEVIE